MKMDARNMDLCMVNALDDYTQLRKGTRTDVPFWDIVVLTTSDAAQQHVYELEIKNKLSRNELPSCATYLVYHDPPGPKIGSGGSTMYTLNEISKTESNWKTKKILIMHAGGASQRLPNASIFGKAFITIPIENNLYTMFDLKLALCMPFVPKLSPGVFISAPDTMETFNFGNNSEFELQKNDGFVALAHPSPLSIGKNHGVFVLEDGNRSKDTEVLQCAQVLQKPSEQLMKSTGAIITKDDVPPNIRESCPDTEWVFTDSQFFFDHTISEKLLKYYKENNPLTCELCAYGDFMQPLGSNAKDSYTKNCKNMMSVGNGFYSLRQKLFHLLKNSPLQVIALKQSKFYHIGSLPEFVDNLCENDSLSFELRLSRFCYSVTSDSQTNVAPAGVNGCVMHSIVTSTCKFNRRSVVEFCDFEDAPVTIGENCVISNCTYKQSTPVSIPDNTFIQTVPIKLNDNVKYVSLVFSVKDDMKAKVSQFSSIGEISYFERGLLNACDMCNIDRTRLFAEDSPFALWNARLFPTSDSAEQSFLKAIETVKQLTSPVKRPHSPDKIPLSDNGSDQKASKPSNGCSANCSRCGGRTPKIPSFYSFADVVMYKDIPLMIEERNHLTYKIDMSTGTLSQ